MHATDYYLAIEKEWNTDTCSNMVNLENIMGVTESRKKEYILYDSIYETLETVNLISIHQKHVIGCLG